MKFLKDIWRKITGFFKDRKKRAIAGVAAIAGIGFIAMSAGGIIMTATVVVLATYIGTLITLSRIPEKVPESANPFVKVIATPFVWIRNFLFRHRLILTVGLAAATGAVVGYTTVTGFVAMALSALLGDALVTVFTDGLSFLKELSSEEEEVKEAEVCVA